MVQQCGSAGAATCRSELKESESFRREGTTQVSYPPAHDWSASVPVGVAVVSRVQGVEACVVGEAARELVLVVDAEQSYPKCRVLVVVDAELSYPKCRLVLVVDVICKCTFLLV